MREGHSSHIYKSRGQNRSYDKERYQPRTNDRNRSYGTDRIIKVVGPEETLEGIIGKIVEKGTEMKGIVTMTAERNRNRSGERTFVRNYRRDRSSSNDRSRSGSRVSTNRGRIRCYICREYDHFVGDCPNYREERNLEQLQHMLNMEEQDSRNLSTHSSDEDCRSPLNL